VQDLTLNLPPPCRKGRRWQFSPTRDSGWLV